MVKRIRSLLIALIIMILFLFLWFVRPNCIFKDLIGIPCPACGLTRAFENIFCGNFINSFDYNILGFPLFIFGSAMIGMLIYDLFKNDDLFVRFLTICFNRYYWLIIVMLLLSWGINIYRAI